MSIDAPPPNNAPRQRRARTFRELSQRLLVLASRPVATRLFLTDVARLLTAFTACDALEIWVRRGRRRLVGWSYTRQSETVTRVGTDELNADGSLPYRPGDAPAPFQSVAPLALRFGEEVGGWLELRSLQPTFFTPAKIDLYDDIALTLGAAIAYQRAQLAQRERVKELTCLYQIARVSADAQRTEPEVLERIVALLPPAWQHPDVAAARITVDEAELSTPGFDQAVQVQRAAILMGGHRAGAVEVGYLEDRATLDEGPFLEEERHLLDAVAEEIAQIIARKRAEAERVQLREQLRHADRLATIGQLAAGVAHELNEPLGSILGFAQLAQKAASLPEQARQDLGRIESAALHSREIVRKLSLFARQTPALRVPLDVTRVVREGLFLLESRCRKEGTDLVLELAEGLPPVEADSGQLTQVLMNLVVNALQATPSGGKVRVATERSDDGVCLTVQDFGPGIPPSVAARIFEPFFTTKDVGEGTGLGLSVVHGIVAAHAGRIRVQTAPGKGTAFTVILPVKETP